jgi:hypothetical protein
MREILTRVRVELKSCAGDEAKVELTWMDRIHRIGLKDLRFEI